jgi:hypothetical protein
MNQPNNNSIFDSQEAMMKTTQAPKSYSDNQVFKGIKKIKKKKKNNNKKK